MQRAAALPCCHGLRSTRTGVGSLLQISQEGVAVRECTDVEQSRRKAQLTWTRWASARVLCDLSVATFEAPSTNFATLLSSGSVPDVEGVSLLHQASTSRDSRLALKYQHAGRSKYSEGSAESCVLTHGLNVLQSCASGAEGWSEPRELTKSRQVPEAAKSIQSPLSPLSCLRWSCGGLMRCLDARRIPQATGANDPGGHSRCVENHAHARGSGLTHQANVMFLVISLA